MLYYVLFCHWVADFVCQHPWMATNKHHSGKALLAHVLTYTTVLMCMMIPFTEMNFNFIFFVLANGACHLAVDSVTSKITANLWQRESKWAFFCMIGFDQFLHTAFLTLTLQGL